MIGRGQDEIAVPEGVTTVDALLNHLVATDEKCAAAFSDLRTLKVAVDQNYSALDASIVGAREIAFFPPVTGG